MKNFNLKSLICISVTFIIVSASNLCASTITLQPGPTDGIDTYVYSNMYAGNNYGSDEMIYVVNPNVSGFYSEGLIKFDVSSYTNVQSAHLNLYLYISSCDAEYTTVSLHKITSDWDESTVTWNTKPSYDATPVASLELYDNQYYYENWISFDITSIVSSWTSGETNRGLVIVCSEWEYNYKFFRSSDYLADPSQRPKLILDAEVGAPIPEPLTIILFGMVNLSMFIIRIFKK